MKSQEARSSSGVAVRMPIFWIQAHARQHCPSGSWEADEAPLVGAFNRFKLYLVVVAASGGAEGHQGQTLGLLWVRVVSVVKMQPLSRRSLMYRAASTASGVLNR